MEIIKDTKEISRQTEKRCLALGTFDGLHLGHQSVLKRLKEKAAALQLKPAVFTFNVHPLAKVFPQKAPPLLNTIEEKIELLKKEGIAELFLLEFNEQIATLSPEQFIKGYLLDQLQTKQIVVGFNYTFAKERKGTVQLLQNLGEQYGMGVEIVAPFYHNGEVVSSTRVRKLINSGKIEEANVILGYPYFIQGAVVHGQKNGRKMGYPTANVDFNPQKALPPNGVYAVTIEWKEKFFQGIANIGYRPTFRGKNLSLEVHIFSFDDNLYDETIKVNFCKEIRAERLFNDINQLIEQIKLDTSIAQKYFKSFLPSINK